MDTADFTTDTRKDHCPIRVFYAAADPAAGPLHTNELDADPRWTQGRHPIAVIKATEHSDYSGGSVEASNYACLQELSVREPGQWPLFEIYGSHGYQALAYDATLGPVPSTWELCNALDGFENGDSVFDDDHHSMLEAELEEEAWDDHGRSDFRKRLEKTLDAIDPNHEHILPDDEEPCPAAVANELAAARDCCYEAPTWQTALYDLWALGCDILNVNGGSGHAVQTGCVVHFYIDEWFTNLGRGKVHRGPTLHTVGGGPVRALLLVLCASLACPVSADPPRKPAKQERKAKPRPACKRTKYRYIGKERVPWDHSEDDHEWDEFDHTTDECEPPPC